MQPLRITLRGVTNHTLDPSIDTWRTVSLPLLRNLIGHESLDELQLKVLSRGCSPLVHNIIHTLISISERPMNVNPRGKSAGPLHGCQSCVAIDARILVSHSPIANTIAEN